ncbi:MAG TPA: sigma-70 family RNA polymerase sigma factor [Acetobacteraceae bacterium]
MRDDDGRRRFELLALPHLDAAYDLARWLTGNTADASDVAQEAFLRAFRYFDAYNGGDMRVWLLTIVRNTFSTWVRANRSARLVFSPDSPADDDAAEPIWAASPRDPEAALIASIDAATLNRLMARLPAEHREVLVLRELEDLSYREIATVTGVPVGTVMSRLARARLALRRLWLASETESAHGL